MQNALPILRIARPTDRLTQVTAFYRDGLGFDILAQFQDHAGFDGVILGHPGAPWHLEFTTEAGTRAGDAPSPEHLLTLYLPDAADWQAAVDRLHAHGAVPVPSHNPYWDAAGITFADPDGYRVVLSRQAWTL